MNESSATPCNKIWTVNYIDIGALDCSEADSLFSASETIRTAALRDIKQLLSLLLGKRLRRPPLASLKARRYLRKVSPLLDSAKRGRLCLRILLVDPQLSLADLSRLEKVLEGVPNVTIHYAPVAIYGERTAFVRFFRPARRQSMNVAAWRDIGASVYAAKNNVTSVRARSLLGLSVSQFVDLLQETLPLDFADFNVLRMNAEGIEYSVLSELDARGLLGHVSLLCGTGNDLQKIDATLAGEFDAFLCERGLSFELFGGDDWRRSQFRRKWGDTIAGLPT